MRRGKKIRIEKRKDELRREGWGDEQRRVEKRREGKGREWIRRVIGNRWK